MEDSFLMTPLSYSTNTSTTTNCLFVCSVCQSNLFRLHASFLRIKVLLHSVALEHAPLLASPIAVQQLQVCAPSEGDPFLCHFELALNFWAIDPGFFAP